MDVRPSQSSTRRARRSKRYVSSPCMFLTVRHERVYRIFFYKNEDGTK